MGDPVPKVSAESVVRLNPSWVLREEDDGDALLFDADSGAVWVANATAVAIWNLIDGQRTVAGLTEALSREFEGFDEAARRDVDALVTDLLEVGAVQAVS